MTMIFADLKNHALYVDSAVTTGDGRRPWNGANKIQACADGFIAMSGLFSASASLACFLSTQFEGVVKECSYEFKAYGDDESGDGFIITAEQIYCVIYMHGRVNVVRASTDIGDAAGSGQTWFNVLRDCGHDSLDAFDLVLKHHNDCQYPASIIKYNGGVAERSVVQELFQ